MLSVWQVVNYNSALQHHPRITDTSDAEDEEQISLSQSSSVRTNPDNVLVLVVVSAFRM
ncbi:hypothetical protein T03_11862 [Trichinella britovi]|uniref:Uncharacterized protein n=1 Tax=Trichinella britovi TaxID=45882 RepID=A0A0V1C642_TRIBR|nr:hypothetical protein T03_11862 [Trichinella britovi]